MSICIVPFLPLFLPPSLPPSLLTFGFRPLHRVVGHMHLQRALGGWCSSLPPSLPPSLPRSLLTLGFRPLHRVVKHTHLQRALSGVAEGEVQIDGLERHQVVDTEGIVA